MVGVGIPGPRGSQPCLISNYLLYSLLIICIRLEELGVHLIQVFSSRNGWKTSRATAHNAHLCSMGEVCVSLCS